MRGIKTKTISRYCPFKYVISACTRSQHLFHDELNSSLLKTSTNEKVPPIIYVTQKTEVLHKTENFKKSIVEVDEYWLWKYQLNLKIVTNFENYLMFTKLEWGIAEQFVVLTLGFSGLSFTSTKISLHLPTFTTCCIFLFFLSRKICYLNIITVQSCSSNLPPKRSFVVYSKLS